MQMKNYPRKVLLLFWLLFVCLMLHGREATQSGGNDSGTDEAKQTQQVVERPEDFSRKGAITLPEPRETSAVSVEACMKERRSVRSYTAAPLSLANVSQLLWAAYGVSYPLQRAGLRGGLKTAPSAGALYPLEIYLVVGNVTGLSPGVYYYLCDSHKIVMIKPGDTRDALCRAAYGQTMVRKAPVSIVYSAVFSRTTNRYGQRGRDRYVCMDLGHSAQNVYLQAHALGLGTCAVGAFNDQQVHQVVGMSRAEDALYIMPIGKR